MLRRLQEITFGLSLFTAIVAYTALVATYEPRSKEGICFGIIFFINICIVLFVQNKIND